MRGWNQTKQTYRVWKRLSVPTPWDCTLEPCLISSRPSRFPSPLLTQIPPPAQFHPPREVPTDKAAFTFPSPLLLSHCSIWPLNPPAMATFSVRPEAQAKVDVFRKELCAQAEILLGTYFPVKVSELDEFLKDPSLNEADLSLLKAALDIPIPDPAKEKEKEERRKQEEKEEKDGKKKEEDEDKGPPCGPVSCNEKIVALLGRLKPEIKDVKEQLNVVSMWLQLQVPRIEDGNNFGVAVQEKVFELMTTLRTKLDGFQTQISKYFSERGDAVAKAAKQPHVGDYRQLVHELDEAQYGETRLMVMEIRNTYAVLYDIILKNFEKIKKPRGDTKGMIY